MPAHAAAERWAQSGRREVLEGSLTVSVGERCVMGTDEQRLGRRNVLDEMMDETMDETMDDTWMDGDEGVRWQAPSCGTAPPHSTLRVSE